MTTASPADAPQRIEQGNLIFDGIPLDQLAADPDLLLLDEPITGLDLPSQLRILDVIDECVDEGRTVIFSTHHLAEARRAERVMLMAACVLADGPPGDVLVPALLAEAFGGRDHTTVMYAVEKIKEQMTERHTTFEQVNELIAAQIEGAKPA